MKITEPDKIHRLHIQPEDPLTLSELEHAVEALKRESETPRKYQYIYSHKDEVVDGCEVIMKSFYKPKLVDDFENVVSDGELLGKFVQAVGHLKIFEDGNVFLSVHILEPAYPDNFDPVEI
tara:strand:+ start:466 stop:828 length:363 start_codon:yes stop_codon:yes gene_type:complete